MTSSQSWPCAALPSAELAPRTTLKVGGRAEWLLEPTTPDELRMAWCAAREWGCVPRVLGGGANLIVGDGELPGVVIATERMRRTFRPLPPGVDGDPDEYEDAVPRTSVLERCDDPRLVVWAGATMPGLVRTAGELGWSGLEGLVGVPGSVGGGVTMNAGGGPGCMWDVVEAVRVLTGEGELRDLERDECRPSYRDGGLGGAVVTGAVLRLSVDNREAVRARTREHLLRKKRVQPVTEASSGCVFKNPDPAAADGCSAGLLVERCGLKGRARGGAVVSELHGNFIVNRGGATGADVLGLLEEVRAEVAERTGVLLEVEARVWL